MINKPLIQVYYSIQRYCEIKVNVSYVLYQNIAYCPTIHVIRLQIHAILNSKTKNIHSKFPSFFLIVNHCSLVKISSS